MNASQIDTFLGIICEEAHNRAVYNVQVWEQASMECLKCGCSTLSFDNACDTRI